MHIKLAHKLTMKTINNSRFPTILVFFLLIVNFPAYQSGHNYYDALSRCIMFFEGQRSGWLPRDQRMTWRGNSALGDGWQYKTDLVGGYYDAGDNVKFNFPMAFTTTLLSWSVIEFGNLMPPNELRNALVAIRWSTDYLLKSISQNNRIFVQVGDPNADHSCWERPEDMDTVRTVYALDAPNPASDVAGETAAALAAASIAFRNSDWGYADTLLRNAKKAFQYADNFRGAYSDNANIRNGVCPFYCDWDGYQDELLWAAAWLRRATGEEGYLWYIEHNGKSMGAEDSFNEFGWDNKHAGFNVLISMEALEKNVNVLEPYRVLAERFMCSLIPESPSDHIEFSPGGLMYKPGGSNMQHVTSITLLMVVYAKYLEQTSRTVTCGNQQFSPTTLRQHAKRQVDYILGSNPKGMSYMVGYSNYYPGKIHHRGSSLPSIKDHPQKMACQDGSAYFNAPWPNANVLMGAIVGGPGEDDVYEDDRADFRKSEPTTYINAPFVGVLAYFVANPNI